MLKPLVIGRALGAVSPAMAPLLMLSARLLCSMRVGQPSHEMLTAASARLRTPAWLLGITPRPQSSRTPLRTRAAGWSPRPEATDVADAHITTAPPVWPAAGIPASRAVAWQSVALHI